MMKGLIKITTPRGYTGKLGSRIKRTKWVAGEWVRPLVKSKTPKVCTDTVVHAFSNIEKAREFVSDPGHAWVFGGHGKKLTVWSAEGVIVAIDSNGKVGCSKLRVTRKLTSYNWSPPLPPIVKDNP